MPLCEWFQTFLCNGWLFFVNDHYFILVHPEDASDLFFQYLFYIIFVEQVLALHYEESHVDSGAYLLQMPIN
jgi:hypothetical protein